MTNLKVANEIRNQIGSGSLFMLGANNIAGTENSLSFHIKGSRKAKHIKIELNGMDTYDVTFSKWGRNYSNLKQKTINDLFFDQLHEIIEQETGLYTRL